MKLSISRLQQAHLQDVTSPWCPLFGTTIPYPFLGGYFPAKSILHKIFSLIVDARNLIYEYPIGMLSWGCPDNSWPDPEEWPTLDDRDEYLIDFSPAWVWAIRGIWHASHPCVLDSHLFSDRRISPTGIMSTHCGFGTVKRDIILEWIRRLYSPHYTHRGILHRVGIAVWEINDSHILAVVSIRLAWDLFRDIVRGYVQLTSPEASNRLQQATAMLYSAAVQDKSDELERNKPLIEAGRSKQNQYARAHKSRAATLQGGATYGKRKLRTTIYDYLRSKKNQNWIIKELCKDGKQIKKTELGDDYYKEDAIRNHCQAVKRKIAEGKCLEEILKAP
ncbi:MAG TPA: hypothetical protein VLH56_10205 [Dissulfurispiraceae bacterium]|nr:hypothetical protein [Dissulfurispiraceae bacterium]